MAAREQKPVLSLWTPVTTLEAEVVCDTQKARGNWGDCEKLPRAVQQGSLVPIQTWNLLLFLRSLLVQVQIVLN